MVIKLRKGKQSSRRQETIEEFLHQTLGEEPALRLRTTESRGGSVTAAEPAESLPPSLYDPFAVIRRARVEPLAGEHSVVVILPFKTISADSKSNLFLDLADALSLNLIENYDLFTTRVSAVEIGTPASSPLDADFTVSGLVQLAGERIYASIQLTSVRDDATIWVRPYAEYLRDLIRLEDAISKDIVCTLSPAEVTRKGITSGRRRYLPAPEAYLSYRQGRATWNKFIRAYFYELGRDSLKVFTAGGFRQAIDLFQRAEKIDPGYAETYAARAEAYTYLGLLGLIPHAVAFARARRFARAAIKRNDALPHAYTSLAYSHLYYTRRWRESERDFRKALELNPKYPPARVGFAELLTAWGRFEEALDEINQALALDQTPLTALVHCFILYESRNYEMCKSKLEEERDKFPHFDPIYYLLSIVYVQLGMFKEARKAARKSLILSDHNSIKVALQAFIYAKAGDLNSSRRRLKELHKLRRAGTSISTFHVSAAYAALAERSSDSGNKYLRRAFAYLRKGCQGRDQWMFLLKVDPRFDSIRYDPRFTDLLKEIGLESVPSVG